MYGMIGCLIVFGNHMGQICITVFIYSPLKALARVASDCAVLWCAGGDGPIVNY